MALKILQLLPALNEGGVERGTVEICQALVEAGHQAWVVSAGGRLESVLNTMGVEHRRWPVGRKSLASLCWIPRLRRLFREQRFDVVHARSRLPAWLAYLAWRGMPAQSRPRFVTTAHGFYSVGRYSEIMTRGERVIAVSEAMQRYLGQNYPRLDPDRVVLIHRGVDPAQYPRGYQPDDRWLSQWRAQHPELQNRFLVLLPGRLRRLKGHEVLLDLLAQLPPTDPPVHALIAGDDTVDTPYVRALKQRVATECLPVSFLGFRDDLKQLYTRVNLVLSLSTRSESFGRTVLEPLCLGTPVVGYDEGGVGEILQTMYPVGAVPRDDTQALLDKVLALVKDPVPVTADNAYPLARMQQRTLELYRQLAEEHT